jgi:hypothetical protein
VTAPLLWWLASWLLRLYCAVARPRELTCPPHTWLPNGIRPSGEFACAPALTGDVRRDGAGGTRDDSVQPEGGDRREDLVCGRGASGGDGGATGGV